MVNVTRREFLQIAGVLGATFAITTQLPEGLLKEVSAEELKELKQAAAEVKTYVRNLSLGGGSWGPSNCVAVDVKNGRIVRIRPLHYDWKYKPGKDFQTWSFEVNGKKFEPPLKTLVAPYALVYKMRVYSPSRLRYPLKRVDFDHRKSPNQRNPQNRGISGFVRISWDEALEILTSELKRIKETYGPYAILVQSDFHGESKAVHTRPGAIRHFLRNFFGGCITQARNPDSWEGYYWGAKHVWGMDGGQGQNQYRRLALYDFFLNGELALFWGCDAETTPNGHNPQRMASLTCYWLKEAGKRVINIAPDLNYSAALPYTDKWIPVRPNTDATVYLAIAYVWITEGTYDKQYVETHTYGFEHFKRYVLGEEDGVPKTPKWAEQISGVPSRTIKALARLWASKRTSMFHCNGGPTIRGQYATEPARLETYCLAMQGIGKPGVQQIQMHEWGGLNWPFGTPSRTVSAGAAARGIFGIGADPPFVPKTLIPSAILGPWPFEWYGTTLAFAPVQDQFVKYKFPPEEGYPTPRMVWTETPCWTTCWNGGNELVKAYRSSNVEFFVAQHFTLEDDALFADLVLPVTTTFENDIDIMTDNGSGQYNMLYVQYRCVDPVGESKSDVEIVETVAEKLGYDFTYGKSHFEWAKEGWANSGVQDLISWEELLEKQYYVVSVDPTWKEYAQPGFRWYWELPEGQGLNTKSGKIEFFCQWLYENFGNDPERPPVARWIPYGETHQESLFHPRAKKYPLLVVSNHPRWREHANLDDNMWLSEIATHKIRGPDGYLYYPMWIHPIDAAKRGIKHGDIVKVYNERGAILCAAYVTERIMPGAISIDHGQRLDPVYYDPDGKIGLDRGGTINLICPYKTTSKNAFGMVVSAFLVEVEKVDVFELAKRYPEAFKKKYDERSGQTTETWLARG
ncbi:MAG: molybdopterin-dependent oxidoreductase [Nitrososphaerota archaeon]